jgi:transcriptional regulator with XRE-family HTH domain
MNDDDKVISSSNSNPGSFAARLWHARGAVPLTQEELAERAGIQGGQATIAHYEAARREPGLENLRRLVRALDCGADYLLATRPGTDDDYRDVPRLGDGNTVRQATPREALRNSLADGLPVAIRAGDIEAARIIHDTLGRLLEPSSGPVVDLASERARRGA